MARAVPSSRAPRVLVIYGTTEGHSAKIAATLGDTLRGEGLNVDVIDAAQSAPDAQAYDAGIVVASVHGGAYRTEVLDWTRRNARALNAMPGAFVSVSLGVLQDAPEVQQESREIRERFLERTGWKPVATHAAAGALRYSRYNVVKRLMMKRIAAQAGGDTDASRDYEYTDWTALARFARAFAAGVRA